MSALSGLHWYDNGQAVLSGTLLEAYRRLDAWFVSWAKEIGAEEIRFPTFLPARELAKLQYFHSFPHLVTFPVVLADDAPNLEEFVGGEPIDAAGVIKLTRTGAVRDVLTPAACYHIYVRYQGTDFAGGPRLVTTVNTCFRREKYYRALERQWAFSMREIVMIGTGEEVQAFLAKHRARVEETFRALGLKVDLVHATDPFFNPSRNPKYIAQKLDPVKHEMVFRRPGGAELAIGSLNYHRSYFGAAFGLTRDGAEAHSGCVAFGLERWLLALAETHGEDPARWPLPS